jgi:hypothetical protein
MIAAGWLGYQFWRLLWQPWPMGGIDLRLRHWEVNRWFAGEQVYNDGSPAVYPPASYIILWPFLGWNRLETARWIWAFISAGALGWLIAILRRESHSTRELDRLLIAVVPLAMYATGATIGNGQLLVPLLPVLLAALLLLGRSQPAMHRISSRHPASPWRW